MRHRRPAFVLSFLLSLLLGRVVQGAAPPAMRSAVSRLSQGGRSYDVALAPAGPSGIEPRSTAHGMTLVITFNQNVKSGKISIGSGKAALNGAPKFSGKSLTIKLTDVADAQEVSLRLDNISAGGAGLSTNLKFRCLEGDVNGDAVVDDKDVAIAKKHPGAIDGTSFRADVNSNGIIRASDINLIKANLGHKVGGVVSENSPPIIKPIANQKLVSGRTPPGIGVAVKAATTPVEAITVVATSDNPSVVPLENAIVSGDGEQRVLTVTPAAGSSGTANVTVTASDGISSSSQTFVVNVQAPPTAYVANLRPTGGNYLLGSGQAVLLLSSDLTQATVRLNFTNLTSAKTAAHIRGPAAPGQTANSILDLNTLTPAMDGSYTWVFAPVGSLQVADIVTAIQTGQTYVDIDSTQLTGELRGQLQLNTGTFTPPTAPPAIASGQPTQNDAARFLVQATYGPSAQDIALIQATGFDAWLQQQFNLPATFSSASLVSRQGLGETLQDDQFSEAWWQLSLTAQDQLRQRVAFALSEILVISQENGVLQNQPLAVADYYDMLIADAFSNFRQILEDVTLHPAMGNYLNMLGNRGQYTNSGGQPIIPNENYAREIMQLFSIGLSQLQPDGTLKLDSAGLPIPTYDQSVVQGFARVFTGWNYRQTGQSNTPKADNYQPMSLVVASHENGTKQLLDGITLPAGQGGQKDLADALNQLFNHPNIGPFICNQLIQRLVTDNPSPAYVYRVSQAFADNGQGVRGDMKAVIRAILLDYEARSPNVITKQGYGKLKEPLLRATQCIRALHPVSATGLFKILGTDTELNQTPLRAPTVFNFFVPDYLYPGNLTQAGLVAPEFQITYETSVINYSNFMESSTRSSFKGADIKLDLSTEQALVNTTTGDSTALVDRLNTTMMSGGMSSGMRTTLISYLNSISPLNDSLTRARAAAHLITTSTEYCNQK